ncbi:MAG: SHOCT domain-containing protein [Phycisphaerae bacterium]
MPQTAELLWYIVWIGVIGVSAMLIGIAVSRALRKRLRAERRTESFTIQDLREMRERGTITQQEYEAMRATILGRMVADSPMPASSKSDPSPARSPEVENDAEDRASGPTPDDER